MKRLALVVTLVLLAGCDPAPLPDGTPISTAAAYNTRTYDSQYGVACYRLTSSHGVSCVKVQ